MAAIELAHVRKSYGGLDVIRDVSVEMAKGDFTVIVGPSGCGKSTLLRMIAGLEEVTGGDLIVDGMRANEVDAADRGMAMVFQSYALYPHMTVRQNMSFALRMQGTRRAEIDAQVRHAADLLQIGPLLDRKPRQLSGGQRQRVAIGRAIVRDPEAFLFDEPLSNLDAELRVQMRVELARLHERLGTTMIYVTHDQVEAMTLASRIVVMRAGQVEQVGTPATLYEDPANLFVAGFIGTPRTNALKGRAEAGGLVLADDTRVPSPLRGAVRPGEVLTLTIRPELVNRDDLGPSDIQLSGRIEVIENLGGMLNIHFVLTTGEPVVAQMRQAPGASVGSTMNLGVRLADLRIFGPDGVRLR
jgi:lactose/L-arabinose transport system ATP-binding protein